MIEKRWLPNRRRRVVVIASRGVLSALLLFQYSSGFSPNVKPSGRSSVRSTIQRSQIIVPTIDDGTLHSSSSSCQRQQIMFTASTSDDVVYGPVLSPLELWCVKELDDRYAKAQAVKCPFFRRRYSDLLDHVESFVRTFVIRNQCLPLIGPPESCRHVGKPKSLNLPIEEILAKLHKDWTTRNGYYVTGKLSTEIYRNDCLFESPDPDLPIRGLRKYLGVACQLFDQKKSTSKLLSLEVMDDDDNDKLKLFAKWNMKVCIKLPWRPELPEFSGTTTYHLDRDHLIYRHEETWEIPVYKAFWALLQQPSSSSS